MRLKCPRLLLKLTYSLFCLCEKYEIDQFGGGEEGGTAMQSVLKENPCSVHAFTSHPNSITFFSLEGHLLQNLCECLQTPMRYRTIEACCDVVIEVHCCRLESWVEFQTLCSGSEHSKLISKVYCF